MTVSSLFSLFICICTALPCPFTPGLLIQRYKNKLLAARLDGRMDARHFFLSSFQSCLFSFSFPFCRLFATCPFALVSPGLALPRLACCALMSNLSWLALPRLASSSPLVPWKSANLNNYWKSIEIMKATTTPLAVVTESCWATGQKQKGPTLRNAIDTRLPNYRHHPIMKLSRKKERKKTILTMSSTSLNHQPAPVSKSSLN